MEHSKEYFRTASAEKTWADASKWPLAHRTCAYMMNEMKPRGKVCLSLGCGWGRFLRAYLESGAKIVIGADINKQNLIKCKGIGGELVLCDIENSPFRDNVFGAMELVATMEHIAHPEKVVREMRRIISEIDGTAFISWNHYRWLKGVYDKLVRERLFWAVRDSICNSLPASIRSTLVENKFPGFKNYGTDRNSGYSFPAILQIHEKASMHIIIAKYLNDEDIIITCSKAAKSKTNYKRVIDSRASIT